MKRRILTQHLRQQGCSLLRQGRNHEWWVNTRTGERSAVPRHSEVKDLLAKKICGDLGVAELKRRR